MLRLRKSPWWCTKSTGKTRYSPHTIRATAVLSWDMLVSCSCQRTETPTGKAIHPFSSAISISMYDPFQWPQCPGVSVISFCWTALPVRFDANTCKDNREPLKILLGLSEDEILQSLTSSNTGHSPSNTATASTGFMQTPVHPQYPPMPAHCISLILQLQAHLFFQTFQIPVLVF